ncbi:hypothetical protein BOX15_Mlig030047g1 [Macrostomum lignano]|uniref:Protein kinase domain-containing protein n=2 Tax=Macrostomum lignano TaxID=282301 RepID=A0A267E5E1_9PLAT|nr:hypothetical protein BOX15_Mlig030047g1 [Macrostomum lignano]
MLPRQHHPPDGRLFAQRKALVVLGILRIWRSGLCYDGAGQRPVGVSNSIRMPGDDARAALSPWQRIIHRDLKAGNVLLTSDAVVKLADFGVSAIGDSPDVRRGTFIGSQYWMAPEVMACETVDNQGYDVRADVWSLGVTLIELAQMLPPHHNLQPARVTIRVIKGDPPRLSRPSLWSQGFHGFLSRCLVKPPEMRATTQELLTADFIARLGEADRRALRNLIAELRATPEIEVKPAPAAGASTPMLTSISNPTSTLKSTPTPTSTPKLTPTSTLKSTSSPTSESKPTPTPSAASKPTPTPTSTSASIPTPTPAQKPKPTPALVPATKPKPVATPKSRPTSASEPAINLPPPPEFANPTVEGQSEKEQLIESLCQELLDEVLTDEDCDPSVPAVVLSVMQDELEALTDGGFDFTIVQLEPGQSQDNAANPTAGTATKEAEKGTEDPDSVLITKRRVFTDENGNVIVTTTMRTVRKGNEGKLQEQFLSRRAELREQKQRGRAQHKAEAELESLQAAERDRMSARWALEAARADRELEAANQRLQREADAARTPAGERLRARLALEARARRQRAEADESHLGELREVRLRQLGERWRLRQRLAEERSQLETEELRRRLDEQRDALVRRQAEERRGWPRLLKEERAARASNFRDSLRLPMPGSKPITSDDAALQRRLQREFDESEAARTRQSLAELEAKVARELAEFDKRAARQLEDAEREIATRRHQMKEREADQARDIEAAWRQELGELRDRVAAEEEAAAAAAAASFGEVSGGNRHANRP